MVKFLTAHKRCSLWAGMGIGKTSATLFTIDMLQIAGMIEPGNPTLVVGPARVARDTWPDEVSKWEQFQDLRIVSLSGSPQERARMLKPDMLRKVQIYTISYELLPWLVEHFLERWPFRQVVADESDRLKGFREKKGGTSTDTKKAGASGQRAFQIGRVAHNLVDRWINLTGTPSPNGLKDLWGQQWFVDRGQRLGRTHTAFMHRWFMKKWSGHGVQPQPHAEAEIHKILSDVCLTIDPADYFDLELPIVKPVMVTLPRAARIAYKELEKEMFTKLLTGEDIEVDNAAALTNKCCQLANGAVYTKHPEWVAVHDEKIEALRSIQSEAGGTPLLVAYQFKSDLARLLKAFPSAVELKSAKGMAKFKSGDAPIGLAHPGSMGHGIDGLQNVTNILVRFGHNWNLGERMQMLERIGPMRQFQAGFKRPVWIYDIIAADTIDEDIIDAHRSKRSVQDALLNAMKRRS